MANRLRGDTPFEAACLQTFKVLPYVCYRNRDIARIQGKLGPRPADPYAPDVVIEEDVPALEKVQSRETGEWSVQQKKDEKGPVFERRRVLLDHEQRQIRWIEFTNARFTHPDNDSLAICLRHGLERWASECGAPVQDHMLEAALFEEVREELGDVMLFALHGKAVANSTFIAGTQGDDADTKAPSGDAASTTSST